MGKKKLATVEDKQVETKEKVSSDTRSDPDKGQNAESSDVSSVKSSKKRVESGILSIESTYNNTKVV